jgi:hypothetical protein
VIGGPDATVEPVSDPLRIPVSLSRACSCVQSCADARADKFVRAVSRTDKSVALTRPPPRCRAFRGRRRRPGPRRRAPIGRGFRHRVPSRLHGGGVAARQRAATGPGPPRRGRAGAKVLQKCRRWISLVPDCRSSRPGDRPRLRVPAPAFTEQNAAAATRSRRVRVVALLLQPRSRKSLTRFLRFPSNLQLHPRRRREGR